jgi:predicted nucleic acid-binding protein
VAFRAVLDANVLYPFSLRDTLLRLAELELYDPLWSAQILDEATRNLVEDGRIEIWQAERLVEAMRRTFEAAEVPQAQVLALESAMLNDEKDRHVLAAAVAGGAEAVVTANLLDFPPEACDPLGVEAVHPDDFLLGLYALVPHLVANAVSEQAADLQAPPKTLDELLDMLAETVPEFAAAVRERAQLEER